MKIKRLPLAAAGAIGLGAVLAFALPAGAAVSAQSPPDASVRLGGQATLDADGAVVFAPVTIACRSGLSAYLTVRVTENVGGFIASGDANVLGARCTGGKAKFTATVTPTQRAFRKGVAFGQAFLTVCDPNGCQTLVDQRNVDIVKK
jgi:hypothetical protein